MIFGKKKSAGGTGCARCGNKFSMTSIELRFYKEQQLEPPALCRGCRNQVNSDPVEAADRPRIVHGN